MFLFVLEYLCPGRIAALRDLATHFDDIHVLTLNTMKSQIEVIAPWLFAWERGSRGRQPVTVHARDDIIGTDSEWRTKDPIRIKMQYMSSKKNVFFLDRIHFIDDKIKKTYTRIH